MSKRDDIPQPSDQSKKPRLAYSCRCGWIDRGHANPDSKREFIGAANLWKQINNPAKPVRSNSGGGFKVTYMQDMTRHRVGVRKDYFVRDGLSRLENESVALAIFQEVSLEFEQLQANPLFKLATDSGFSVEDLPSNLLGFYKAVRGVDYESVCEIVSPDASLKIWDMWGSVGSHKNRTFRPKLFPCPECRKVGARTRDSKAGLHRWGRYSVSIAENGAIVVKRGDWLSKYSAAIYAGDTSRVFEYARPQGGALVPIADVDHIVTGETIYHLPTYQSMKKQNVGSPRFGDLPAVYTQIKPARKGILFRDWAAVDDAERSLGYGQMLHNDGIIRPGPGPKT